MSNNLAARLQENADRFPEKPALIIPGSRHSWKTVTYHQLNERSRLFANGLCSYGIRLGTRAVLMAPPSVDFFALVFALLQTGIVPVMLDPAIGLRNVRHCLADAEPEVYFGSTLTHAIRLLFGWGKDSLRLNLSLPDLVRAGASASEFQPLAVLPESEAAIVYTSGSTGLPKGVVYTHANFAAQIEMLVKTLQLHGDEVDLPAFPLFALIDCLLGVTAIIPDLRFPAPARVNPARLAAAIQHQKVDTMFVSPAALDRLARYGVKNKIRLKSLKKIISAGAPAPVPVQKMFRRLLLDEAELFGVYGSTETLPVSTVNSHVVLTETSYLSEQGAGICIGRPVEGAQVRIIPIHDGIIPQWHTALNLPVGVVGEITVKGAAVTELYVGQEKATLLAKIRDADNAIVHRMGDLGYFDEKGRLWYCGRKSHRVLTATETLFTESVEGIFNSHPQVFRSALVGVVQAGITVPVLWIQMTSDSRAADQNQLRVELLRLAKAHKSTQSIQTILFHPAFPTDIRHNSKIIREKLAELAKKRLK